jgi:glycosyltransferase involved in cell wall biosynthesis
MARFPSARIILFAQESVAEKDWPAGVTIERIPDGPIASEALSRRLAAYPGAPIHLVLTCNHLRGFGEILCGARTHETWLEYPDGAFRRVLPEDEASAALDPAVAVAREYARTLAMELPPVIAGPKQVVMLVNADCVHDSRVFRHAATLADSGFPVSIVARAIPGQPREESPRPGVRLLRPAQGEPDEMGLLRVAATIPAIAVHSNDINALHLGAILARRNGVPLVHDAHECWWGELPEGRYPPAFMEKHLDIEARFADAIALLFTATETMATMYSPRYRRRAIALRNCARRCESFVPDASSHEIAFTGNIAPNRHLGELIRALTFLPASIRLSIRAVRPEQAVPYRELVDRLHLGDRVDFPPPVPPADVTRVVRDAWLGFTTTFKGVCLNDEATISNKFFEFIAAGVPVVSGNAPEAAGLVERYGVGVVARSPRAEDLAAAFRRLHDDPVMYAKCRSAARQAADVINWETESRKLLDGYRSLGLHCQP